MKRHSRFPAWVLALLTLAACATPRATPEAASGEPSLAIHHVRIFDGERVIPDGTVVVRGGKIVAVGADVSPPQGAELVDGQGQTLLPGLVDAHFHADGPDAYRSALAFGLTTVMDTFPQLSASMMHIPTEQLPQRGPDEADTLIGLLITAPGGHGTEYPGVTALTATTPQECEAAVETAVKAGSHFIKLVYDSGESVLPKPIPTLSRETLAGCIQAAHARNRLVVVHSLLWRQTREALEAGADGLAHGVTDTLPDVAELRSAARRGAFGIPTVAVALGVARQGHTEALQADPLLAPYLTPSSLRMMAIQFPDWVGGGLRPDIIRQAPRLMMEAGMPVLAGSDCGNPGVAVGASFHYELEMLVASGMTPVQALASATSVPARSFQLADRGRIAPGLRADLLLVRGDPTADVRQARDIVAVWKEGRRLDREAWRAQLEASRLDQAK
jgi:imidazolonepropionase-like amidohydrolase